MRHISCLAEETDIARRKLILFANSHLPVRTTLETVQILKQKDGLLIIQDNTKVVCSWDRTATPLFLGWMAPFFHYDALTTFERSLDGTTFTPIDALRVLDASASRHPTYLTLTSNLSCQSKHLSHKCLFKFPVDFDLRLSSYGPRIIVVIKHFWKQNNPLFTPNSVRGRLGEMHLQVVQSDLGGERYIKTSRLLFNIPTKRKTCPFSKTLLFVTSSSNLYFEPYRR